VGPTTRRGASRVLNSPPLRLPNSATRRGHSPRPSTIVATTRNRATPTAPCIRRTQKHTRHRASRVLPRSMPLSKRTALATPHQELQPGSPANTQDTDSPTPQDSNTPEGSTNAALDQPRTPPNPPTYSTPTPSNSPKGSTKGGTPLKQPRSVDEEPKAQNWERKRRSFA
jgi:hypothetical protein